MFSRSGQGGEGGPASGQNTQTGLAMPPPTMTASTKLNSLSEIRRLPSHPPSQNRAIDPDDISRYSRIQRCCCRFLKDIPRRSSSCFNPAETWRCRFLPFACCWQWQPRRSRPRGSLRNSASATSPEINGNQPSPPMATGTSTSCSRNMARSPIAPPAARPQCRCWSATTMEQLGKLPIP